LALIEFDAAAGIVPAANAVNAEAHATTQDKSGQTPKRMHKRQYTRRAVRANATHTIG
jgi:hypothetical protein